MARAYICIARNDLDNNFLQVLDLKPNTSQRNSVLDGAGQTGYQTWFARDAAINSNVATVGGAGGGASVDTTVVTYGLAAYLIDHVQNQDGGATAAITAAMANAARTAIFIRVAAGQACDAAGIAAALTANGVANAAAGTTLIAGTSTGSVEEVLRILAGEVWRLPAASQVTAAAGGFDATVRGGFVARPAVELPQSVRTANGFPVRGRNSFVGQVIPTGAPVQVGLQDTRFRDVRVLTDTGALQLSGLSGQLSRVAVATYRFLNPAFTYGGAGTALGIGGGQIPATGAGRAVTVYTAAGAVILSRGFSPWLPVHSSFLGGSTSAGPVFRLWIWCRTPASGTRLWMVKASPGTSSSPAIAQA